MCVHCSDRARLCCADVKPLQTQQLRLELMANHKSSDSASSSGSEASHGSNGLAASADSHGAAGTGSAQGGRGQGARHRALEADE